MSLVPEYIGYLRDWAKVRNRPVWCFPMRFEDFVEYVQELDEKAAREYESHISTMRSVHRYI